MQLDDETAEKLRALERDGHSLDGVELDENNVATIDFSKAQGVLKFKIDASTTKVNSEAAQLDALKTLIQTLDASQSLNQVVPIKKKLAAWNAIVANSGIDGLDELRVTEEEMEEMQQMQAQGAQPMEQTESETPEAEIEQQEAIALYGTQGRFGIVTVRDEKGRKQDKIYTRKFKRKMRKTQQL